MTTNKSSLNESNGEILDAKEILNALIALKKGDFSLRLSYDKSGITGKIADTLNEIMETQESLVAEVQNVATVVGKQGKLNKRFSQKNHMGSWQVVTDSINDLITDLTQPTSEMVRVIGAVAKGDLSQTIGLEIEGRALTGDFLQSANNINTMVTQLSTFASEVTRVAREVGTEGKLGGQAEVKDVSGTWKILTDSVNNMAANLTDQVRNIADVTTAVAKGDLSKQITVDAKGEILQLKSTINTMVDQLSTFSSEVTRVAREVGTEGKLGGQAEVKGVGGTWRDLTESVNYMASNLTNQVRNIAVVTTAVANGDLSKKITADVQGEILELKNTINTMVDQLSTFASEVTRVAREVGTEGKLGGQAKVIGVGGTWKDLTESVNYMAGNLTNQVRNIADVTTAVANGDLSKQITVDAKGEILELKSTINTMVDQLSTFASEVTRVAREVGTEGKLGGQAEVNGVGGTWKDLTENVNYMAMNVTNQVRNIAAVTTAVANGDLSKKITADFRGEIFELKNTINTMVDQLSTFASEVTRVAREVGTEGKLGGQAQVKDVGGTWRDLTESVNYMASNLTDQVRNIADVTTAVANGDLSKKITVDVKGEILQLKSTINTMVDQLSNFASEVTRVAREVGTEGKLGGQAEVKDVSGTWKDLTDNVNIMATNLTDQVRGIAKVVTAVANGDLSRKITVNVKGELQELKDTMNTMVDQLNSFASEVTRVAREVGTEGKLGGQSQVRGVGGIWKDLTDNVNIMATNLTDQVRGIAKVVTAVANGNLKRKLTVEAKGEIAELTDTINSMIDTLATFADQVTTVAREVGAEGKLGGQAHVPGAAGTWRDLTDNVNQLAENLTTQVRAITNVATAVTKGDLSRTIAVEAAGEVATLKDNINEMIRNLKETTRINTEQDWLKTNLAKFSRMLQGQRDLIAVCQLILSELAPLVSMQHGVFFINEAINGEQMLKLFASYGYQERKHISNEFKAGQGLIGQCLVEKQRILLTNVPGDYVSISSALGESNPLNIVLLPIIFEGQVLAVLELASFRAFSAIDLGFLDQLTESIGIVLNTMQANMRTEELLTQSQSLTEELQKQQEQLQHTNEELEDKAKMLVVQKAEVESKNSEVEMAKQFLEEKAEQLALTSKYKSEFLANMSHELRTPLNSLLLLSERLSSNQDNNLTEEEVKCSRTIHESGLDLLNLINDILDLSKIESGTTTPEYSELKMDELIENIKRTFAHMAKDKGLEFVIELESNLPEMISTDAKRLQQVIKNLLSNAFKFTEAGKVTLQLSIVTSGWSRSHEILNGAEQVLAISVKDTGIGIPEDKHRIIFEAFQQADGSTSRVYGGTGLGLAISREIADMLHGEIRLNSEVDEGSTFILYLPLSLDMSAPVMLKNLHVPVQSEARKEVKSVVELLISDYEQFVKPVVQLDQYIEEIKDDRKNIRPGDTVYLIIEDDLKFAQILVDIFRKKGIKVIVTSQGSKVVELARHYKPMAITLDVGLQDENGKIVLEYLKNDLEVRHIPVCLITVQDESIPLLQSGAFNYMCKPITQEDLENVTDRINHFMEKKHRTLLIASNHSEQRKQMIEHIANDDIEITVVDTGRKALNQMKLKEFDCLLLDNSLSDITSNKLIKELHKLPNHNLTPIVINSSRNLTPEEEAEFEELMKIYVIKEAKSPVVLLDMTALFLHRKLEDLSETQMEMLKKIHQTDQMINSKTVLLVDDDIRNIFALTGILERHNMKVVSAENGKDAIEILKQNAEIEIVLMDIMMPIMDGYETTRAIRKIPEFKFLPIIALTANAMIGDREKCIEAGASDYITKPVNTIQLLTMIRAWLYI
ncbi:MAG: sensor hybrid histidine kinase [Bacilli bacterium]|nr:sensor hybrid histidine kinase [Bacilli bacterium]